MYVAKYTIDINIDSTYNALYKQNPRRVESTLLRLYYAVMDLRETDEESRILDQLHDRP